MKAWNIIERQSIKKEIEIWKKKEEEATEKLEWCQFRVQDLEERLEEIDKAIDNKETEYTTEEMIKEMQKSKFTKSFRLKSEKYDIIVHGENRSFKWTWRGSTINIMGSPELNKYKWVEIHSMKEVEKYFQKEELYKFKKDQEEQKYLKEMVGRWGDKQ